MGSKRTRKGGKRRRVIANYFGTCSRLHGRKKTRCLLDKKRDFWDALGFGGHEYDIYEKGPAQEAFLNKFNDDEKLRRRVKLYLLENRGEDERHKYFLDKRNEDSMDDETIKRKLDELSSKTIITVPENYLKLTVDDDHLKKKANYEKHLNRIMSDKPKEKTRRETSRLSPVKEETYPSHYYSLSKTGKYKARRKLHA